jgi:hypothetical protein
MPQWESLPYGGLAFTPRGHSHRWKHGWGTGGQVGLCHVFGRKCRSVSTLNNQINVSTGSPKLSDHNSYETLGTKMPPW